MKNVIGFLFVFKSLLESSVPLWDLEAVLCPSI